MFSTDWVSYSPPTNTCTASACTFMRTASSMSMAIRSFDRSLRMTWPAAGAHHDAAADGWAGSTSAASRASASARRRTARAGDRDVDPLEAGRRPLEVAVVEREHHGAAGLGPEDPREPVLHPPVVRADEPFRKNPAVDAGTSRWKSFSPWVSASGIASRPSRSVFQVPGRAPQRAHDPVGSQLEQAAIGLEPCRVQAPRRRATATGSGSTVRSNRTSHGRRRRRRRVEPAPRRPAQIAAPRAVDSLTTGTRTGTP